MPRLFEQRMKEMALQARKQAQEMRPGPERDALMKRARQLDIACHVNEWLTSPGLQPPTEITELVRSDEPTRRP
jgi:hypothetical protein